jgi:hypothetical protein
MTSPSLTLSLLLAACSAPLAATPEATAPAGLERVLTAGCAGYATIQGAIDAAEDGDVVEVCAGTWDERLTITGRELTLRSLDGAADTTIDAQTLGKALRISGGAVVTVEGFTFRNGRGGAGGDVSCEASTLDLVDSALRDGEASAGGGLHAVDCDGSVEGTTFEDNVAGWRGGGAYVLGGFLALADATFRANTADSEGGGLFLDGDHELMDSTFEDNHATWGGGAWVNESLGELHDNTLIGNTSTDDGAGLYVFGGAPDVRANTFRLNDSDDEAGGLRVKLSAASVRDNTFTDNHADYRGGAVKVSHGDSVFSGNTYEGNSAWVSGGAVLAADSGSTFRNERFVDNTAALDGGAIAILDGWDPMLLEDCVFEGNHADADGGHLFVSVAGQTVTLRRLELSGGSADRGGALFVEDTRVRVENSVFVDNDAVLSGGAAYLDTAEGDLVNNVVGWNTAPQGSAVTFADSGGVAVTNTVFRSNTGSAASARATGGAPTFTYDDFSGNDGNFSGMAGVAGTAGNLMTLPGFVNASRGNFHLRATSHLRNAGAPAILDEDGTRSDIGLYGGPRSP